MYALLNMLFSLMVSVAVVCLDLKWSVRNESLKADIGKEIQCHENEVSTIRQNRW